MCFIGLDYPFAHVSLALSTTMFSQVLYFLVRHVLCKLDRPQALSLRIQYTARHTARIQGTLQVPTDLIRCSSGLAPVSGSYVLFISSTIVQAGSQSTSSRSFLT